MVSFIAIRFLLDSAWSTAASAAWPLPMLLVPSLPNTPLPEPEMTSPPFSPQPTCALPPAPTGRWVHLRCTLFGNHLLKLFPPQVEVVGCLPHGWGPFHRQGPHWKRPELSSVSVLGSGGFDTSEDYRTWTLKKLLIEVVGTSS